MTRHHRIWIVASTLALCMTVSSAIAGETHSGEGHHVFTYESEVLDLDNENVVQNSRNRGFMTYADESHPFHLASQNCWGTYVGSQEQGTQAGYCILVPNDRSGAVFFSFTGDAPGGGEWTVLRGIGSLEGITGSGTWEPAGPGWQPDSKGINLVAGTIEIP